MESERESWVSLSQQASGTHLLICRMGQDCSGEGRQGSPGLAQTVRFHPAPSRLPLCGYHKHIPDLWKTVLALVSWGLAAQSLDCKQLTACQSLLIKLPHITVLSSMHKPVLHCLNQKYTFDSVPQCHEKGKHPISSWRLFLALLTKRMRHRSQYSKWLQATRS